MATTVTTILVMGQLLACFLGLVMCKLVVKLRQRLELALRPFQLPVHLLDASNTESLFHRNIRMLDLVRPPAGIHAVQRGRIKLIMESLLEELGDPLDFQPEVFVIGAEDVTGTSLFYIAAVLKVLFAHGVPCFSTALMRRVDSKKIAADACVCHMGTDNSMGGGAKKNTIARQGTDIATATHVFNAQHSTEFSTNKDPHIAMLSLLKSKMIKCRVVIVVESASLYRDERCFEQIRAAVKKRRHEEIQMIRLRFESSLPPRDEQWEFKDRGRSKTGDKKLTEVFDALREATVFPGYDMIDSHTVATHPKLLMKALKLIEQKTFRPVEWKPQPSPWETAVRDRKWVKKWLRSNDYDLSDEKQDTFGMWATTSASSALRACSDANRKPNEDQTNGQNSSEEQCGNNDSRGNSINSGTKSVGFRLPDAAEQEIKPATQAEAAAAAKRKRVSKKYVRKRPTISTADGTASHTMGSRKSRTDNQLHALITEIAEEEELRSPMGRSRTDVAASVSRADLTASVPKLRLDLVQNKAVAPSLPAVQPDEGMPIGHAEITEPASNVQAEALSSGVSTNISSQSEQSSPDGFLVATDGHMETLDSGEQMEPERKPLVGSQGKKWRRKSKVASKATASRALTRKPPTA